MVSNKKGIKLLVQRLKDANIPYIVISPGSRSAPVAVTLASDSGFTCLSVIDERSAGYFALGIALQSNTPVGLVCTSGTAVLNYAPALAEAFYQQLPLIAITADRPEELIHQREGQALNQQQVFGNYVKASFHLPQEPWDADRLWYLGRGVAETLNKAITEPRGPVQLNVPLREPLYDFEEANPDWGTTIRQIIPEATLTKAQIETLTSKWSRTSRIMIVLGAQRPGLINPEALQAFQKAGGVIVAEHLANIPQVEPIFTFDQILYAMPPEYKHALAPELVIVAGLDLVSKRLKQFLREVKPADLWAVDPAPHPADTFKGMSLHIKMQADEFFSALAPELPVSENAFQTLWHDKQEQVLAAQQTFDAPWSDWLVFRLLMQQLPGNSHLHLGNSSPVRYGLIFPVNEGVACFSNRGTSGIDGVVSTAAGSAWVANALSFVIAGDVTMAYDSNALWNKYLPENLRIIVINNRGGGIFRLIPGPGQSGHLESLFETHVPVHFQKLCEAHGLDYFSAGSSDELRDVWANFTRETGRPAFLEVRTPGAQNADVYKTYFDYIKQALWQQQENGQA